MSPAPRAVAGRALHLGRSAASKVYRASGLKATTQTRDRLDSVSQAVRENDIVRPHLEAELERLEAICREVIARRRNASPDPREMDHGNGAG